jgi:Domain of unknown function (DUF4157)
MERKPRRDRDQPALTPSWHWDFNRVDACGPEPRLSRQPVADRLARTAAPGCAGGAGPDRRACDGCEPGDPSRAAGTAPDVVNDVLRSPGRPLDARTRTFFEPRFGREFGAVRVHTDAAGAASARAVRSTAYTVGADIVFGSGRYEPDTPRGFRLLAHELAHVVQNGGQRGAVRTQLMVSAPGDAGEREADAAADAVMRGRNAPPLGVASTRVQRTCVPDLGTPVPECAPSDKGVAGWQFMFKVNCDELLPGEAAKIDKLRPSYQLNIHGFASKEGPPALNDQLSCHRANRIAELARAKRADCPVVGTFKHGASPRAAPGKAPDVNPPDFWRSVVVEEVKPALESGETWLDPGRVINETWALYARAAHDPTQTNLDVVVTRRTQIKTWLESMPQSVAPANAQLTRQNLTDYRRFYDSAERVWTSIDQLLALQKHPAAAKDTHAGWAAGTGTEDQGSESHAKNVPTGAKYHIDLFGEGYFPGAVNIGIQPRTTTTGISGTRVPNLIYRRFSSKDANHIPIADHVADLITSESGPLMYPGLAQEIARIIAPGGIIVLFGPDNVEKYHDQVAKATGGTVTKILTKDSIETKIVMPAP